MQLRYISALAAVTGQSGAEPSAASRRAAEPDLGAASILPTDSPFTYDYRMGPRSAAWAAASSQRVAERAMAGCRAADPGLGRCLLAYRLEHRLLEKIPEEKKSRPNRGEAKPGSCQAAAVAEPRASAAKAGLAG